MEQLEWYITTKYQQEGPYREERRILLLYRVRKQGQMMGMNERYYGRAASPKDNRKFGDVPFT